MNKECNPYSWLRYVCLVDWWASLLMSTLNQLLVRDTFMKFCIVLSAQLVLTYQCSVILCGTGWSHEVGHQHSSACYKCCCSSFQWHKKVWPWPEWLESYTMIYTGTLWQIESPINLVSSWTEVSMARLCGTLLTVANWSLTLSIGGVSGQPHSNWWWCHE